MYSTSNTANILSIKHVKSPVLTMSTGPPAQDHQNFVQTSKFFSFYLELHFCI